MNSICIATYNGMPYLREQLDSIFSQISKEDEVIIVDDRSTDDTFSYLKSLNHPQVMISQNEKNLGPSATFHRAIIQSKGNFIFLADQDDIWLPHKLKKCSEALKDAILVTHAVQFVDQNLKKIPYEMDLKGIPTSPVSIFIKNRFIGATLGFQKELKEQCVNQMANAPMHDWWLALIASKIGKIQVLNEKLLLYRRHETTLTKPKKSFQIRPISILYRAQLAYLLTLWELKRISNSKR